jgi:hypothetical protein
MKCIMKLCKYCFIEEDGSCACEAKDGTILDEQTDCDVELSD